LVDDGVESAMWCLVVFGVLTIVWGVITVRGGLAGKVVDVGTYKGPSMASGGQAVIYGAGAIVLGVLELVVAFLWR
jgi:hypothetical protein